MIIQQAEHVDENWARKAKTGTEEDSTVREDQRQPRPA
jgi:hypothetical protein